MGISRGAGLGAPESGLTLAFSSSPELPGLGSGQRGHEDFSGVRVARARREGRSGLCRRGSAPDGPEVLETQEQTSVVIGGTARGQLRVWALTQCGCDGEAFTRLTHRPGQPDGRGGARVRPVGARSSGSRPSAGEAWVVLTGRSGRAGGAPSPQATVAGGGSRGVG